MQKKSIIAVCLSVICLSFPYFTDQSEAKNFKQWTDISIEQTPLSFTNWPIECRLRMKTSADYSSDLTVGFCPRWMGSEEPRTYFRLMEVFSGYYVAGHTNDFSQHPIFTKARGQFFSYFKNPEIKPGQRTTCNDSDCFFRRIEFSVKGKQCQWIFYAPDYVPGFGTQFNLTDRNIPYALEIMTCHTSAPFTKEHIQMKPGKVTVVWPGTLLKGEFSNNNKSLYLDLEAGRRLSATSLDNVIQYFRSDKSAPPETVSSDYESKLTRSGIVNRFLTKPMPRAMFGAFPRQCNKRYWGTSSAIDNAIHIAYNGCQRHFELTNPLIEKKCECKIIAYNNTFFYPPEIYMTYDGNTDYISNNLVNKVTSIFNLEDDRVCDEALNKSGDNWSKDNEKSDYVNLAKYRGLNIDVCKEERKLAESTPASPSKEPIFSNEKPSQFTDDRSTIMQRLETLKKLQDAGLISKEDAAAKRKEILKNL